MRTGVRAEEHAECGDLLLEAGHLHLRLASISIELVVWAFSAALVPLGTKEAKGKK